jgi:hypothetical protein
MKKDNLFLKELINKILKEDVATQDIKKGEEITPEKVKKTGGDKGDVAGGNYEDKLKKIFKQNYPGFVAALGKFAGDPKFQNFVKTNEALKSSVKLTSIPVTKLIPTQNEIDVDKSLKFPLTKKESAGASLKGGAVKVKSPIISFNGKYIIDGHHRWSQVYAINKDASIVAFDFTNPEIKNPLDALKLTQLAIIGAGASKIPTESVKGQNLLVMAEADLKAYVEKTLTDDVLELFKKVKKLESKTDVANYIWANVQSMQKTSQPVSGAPKRDIMPQAGEVPGGQNATIDALKSGLPPIKEREKVNINEVRRLQQVAGLRRKL